MLFKVSGTAVFPVIHSLENAQVCKNITTAAECGAAGVFLINHDFAVDEFLPIIKFARSKFPNFWIGANFLGVSGRVAFPILSKLESDGCRVDGYWADDARIDESGDARNQPEAAEILDIKKQCRWNGIYFGGTAFKKQRVVEEGDYLAAARVAAHWMDVVTTSGVATGHEAGTGKVETFRTGVGDTALGLASGITPENVLDYARFLDAILVATGINYTDDFYNIDPDRLKQLNEGLQKQL